MPFSYLQSINSQDEALFSGFGREIKTKQLVAFMGLVIIALILIHRSPVLAVPFVVMGLVYVNYSDDVMPISSYLAALQEFRKYSKAKTKVQEVQRKREIKITVPTEVQVAGVGLVAVASGFYGIYSSIASLNLVGLVIGSVLVGIGIVVLLSVFAPFLNKVICEGK